MRHGRKTVKLQRRQDHRDALLANLVVSLVEHEQIKTTLAKAKAVRGWKVKRAFTKLTPEEWAAKSKAAFELLGQEMKLPPEA